MMDRQKELYERLKAVAVEKRKGKYPECDTDFCHICIERYNCDLRTDEALLDR